MFADQAAIERRLERTAKTAKSGDKDAAAERERAGAAAPPGWRRAARPGRWIVEVPDALDLLTAKPALYVANVDDTGNAEAGRARCARSAPSGASRCIAAGRQAGGGDRRAGRRATAAAFLEELGIEQPAIERVSLAAYTALDLIPFFTTGPKETRAWTIRRGQNAQEAAGRIHTDLARGFIRAEVIEWDRLVEAGSEAEAKRRGWMRVEGRDYVVADGDTLNVRFNV